MALRQKKSAKLWIWRAYDPLARRTLGFVLGRRDNITCQRLLDKIGTKGRLFLTDHWEGFPRIIPAEQHRAGKHLTVPIEQDNSGIRHCLARFRRRTKVVSKSEEMVELSLRLYHRLHDNPQNLKPYTNAFQSIFR